MVKGDSHHAAQQLAIADLVLHLVLWLCHPAVQRRGFRDGIVRVLQGGLLRGSDLRSLQSKSMRAPDSHQWRNSWPETKASMSRDMQ